MWPPLAGAQGGAAIRVTGSHFGAVYNRASVGLGCKFGTRLVAAWFVQPDVVECRAPTQAAGFVRVELTVNNETAAGLSTLEGAGVQFSLPAAVASVQPAAGVAGTVVTVRGDGFLPGAVCRFGAVEAPAAVDSSTLLRCETPAALAPGPTVLDVANPGDWLTQLAESAPEFSFLGEPLLLALSPRSGPACGGTRVDVYTSGLTLTHAARCRFGTVAVAVASAALGDAYFSCISPAMAARPLPQAFEHTLGNTPAALGGPLPFTFTPALHAVAAVPDVATGAACEAVAVQLDAPPWFGAASSLCQFGAGQVLMPANIEVHASAARCLVSTATAGFTVVRLAAQSLDAAFSSSGAELLVAPAASVAGVSPSAGPPWGGRVLRLAGTHFSPRMVCRFGTAAVPAGWVSSVLLLCEQPALPLGAVAAGAGLPGSAGCEQANMLANAEFLSEEPAVAAHLQPSGGIQEGGAPVLLLGALWQEGAALDCSFGSVSPVAGARTDLSECRCISPAHMLGSVPVQLNSALLRSPYAPLWFEYAAEPSLFSVGQQESALLIYGSGFPPAAAVTCHMCGSALVGGFVRDASSIVCSLPSWFGDGFCVTVTLSDSEVLARAPVEVTYQATEPQPVVLRASPPDGSTQGGTLVALLGADFGHAARCVFSDAQPILATFVSTALLVCESPAHAWGLGELSAAANDGTLAQTTAIFAFKTPLVLGSLQPTRGTTAGGMVVHADAGGRSGDDSAACAFGTVSFVQAAWVSSATVSCTSVAHVPGNVDFTLFVAGGVPGEAAVPTSFTYYVPPAFAVLGPDVVLAGAATSVLLRWDALVPGGVACSTGQRFAVPGRATPTSTFCEISPGTAGFFVVDLTFEQSSGLEQFQLLAVPQPQAASLFPERSVSLSGTLIAVQGSSLLLDDLVCLYNGVVAAPAVHVSSALVFCEAQPQPMAEPVTLHLVSGLSHRLDVALIFRSVLPVGAALVEPAVASTEGGAVLRFETETAADNVLFCKVGTIFPIAATAEMNAVRCIAPARVAVAAVPVAVSTNGRDVEVAASQAVFAQQPMLLGVQPLVGIVDGTTDITLLLDQAGLVSGLRARFDIGTCAPFCGLDGALQCLTPAHAAGFAAVRLQFADGPEEATGLSFQYRTAAVALQVLPPAGPGDGATVVHVIGSDFVQAGAMCFFGAEGSVRVPAHFDSSVLLRCQPPPHAPGQASVETDELAAAARGATTRLAPLYEYLADAAVLATEPQLGGDTGGVAVVFQCTAPQSHCRFGSIAPVLGRALTEGQLMCSSPAAAPQMAWVSTSANALAWSSSLASFAFLRYPAAAAPAWPEVGASVGGDVIQMWVEQDVQLLSWRCVFDTTAVRAQLVSACVTGMPQLPMSLAAAFGSCLGRLAVCTAPAHPAGAVSLSLTSEAGSYAAVDFLYATPAQTAAVLPAAGPVSGGSVVTVFGGRFRPGGAAACVFGATLSAGSAFVSSAALRCETPAAAAGVTTVDVPGSSKRPPVYAFYALVTTAVAPAAGPGTGGTVVEVTGSGFVDSAQLSCRFGTTFPVAASWRSPYVLQCVSPGLYPSAAATLQQPYAVPVQASGNLVDASDAAWLFEYQPSMHVAAATPRSGIHLGQTPVFVLGAGFVNSSDLTCRFGLTAVPGLYLSYAAVLCLAPAQPAGAVFLELSNNGEDFTSDRLIFYYGTCRVGYYCPAGEPLPCPRGSYCAGTANFNFTVCPPGTYQPQVAQAGCLPAPVGHIAPDFGTVYPRLCPRGAVCDAMGLANAATPCPPGHFCLDGTRTANFTDFRIAERPLPCPFGFFCGPGVSANQSIANNVTTPQPCYSGYLCEPGSVTPQGSGPCPSGHYCPPGQLVPCPPRTYCPNVANTEPKPCLPGTYNQAYGQATCKQCPPGTVCPGFARDLPQACPPGYVCDEVGLPLPTARCPAGHFCLSNTVTADPLAPLDEDQLLRESPIPLNASQFRPLPCFPATYCLEGVGNSTTAEGVYFNPQPCNPGSYCEWATSDRTVAGASGTTDISNPKLPCPAGSYCPVGTYIPIPAPRGSFASGTGNAQAALCLPGTYTHYEGFQRCLSCPAGYECRKDGTYTPAICDAGKYRSSSDSITCVTCPLGTWSPYKGLTDASLCLPCNAGLVCGVDGMTNSKPFGNNVQRRLNGQIAACERSPTDPGCTYVTLQPLGQASLCPEGYVCDARTSVAADKCPDGYYCGYGTTPETQFMNLCPAGFFCPAGTSESGKFQFPCLACFYCPIGTGLILPRCPEGTKSLASAMAVSDCIADQITFWRVQPLKSALINRTDQLASGAATSDGNGTSLVSDAGAQGGVNGANTSDVPSLQSVFDAFGRCAPSNFEGLQPSFVLDADTLERTTDVEGTWLVYYTVPRDYTAKLQFDFRNISAALIYGEHYEVMVFTGDYSTQTVCSVDDYQAVPCPPYNPGDGVNIATMGEYPDRKFETKCPRSINALEMPFWFARNGLFGGLAADNNAASPLTGTFVNKRGLMELNLLANDDVQFRVEVRMLHGLYQADARRSFLDTMCIDLSGPQRGSSLPNASFHVILPRNDNYQLPLNIPWRSVVQRSVPAGYAPCTALVVVPTCRYLRPEVRLSYNSSYSSEFMLAERYMLRDAAAAAAALAANSSAAVNSSSVNSSSVATAASSAGLTYSDYLTTVPDVSELESNLLQDPSLYWQGGDPFLAIDYLPFFSACRGFDASVVLYHVLQAGYTEINLPNDYRVAYGAGCQLVPEAETKFINQWAPQIFTPVADVCALEFTCLLQESYATAAAVSRWFESTGDTLFYLTRTPQPRDRLFEASVLATDQTTPPKDLSFYSTALAADGLKAVSFAPDSGSPAAGTVPKVATLALTYFPYTPRDKRIIEAGVAMSEYQAATTHDGTYTLAITLTPLGWFDLLNAFAFDTLFYSALFLGIGMLADALMWAFWGFCRAFTRLRDPPRFKGWSLLSLLVQPQVAGLALAMIPFYAAELGVAQLFQQFSFVATFPANIDNLGVSLADASTLSGRIGVCFMVVALHGLYCTSMVLIPDKPRSDTDGLMDASAEDDEEGEGIAAIVRWKRMHFFSAVLLMLMPDLYLSEFSVGATYSAYLYPCWFMMKIYHMGAQALLKRYMAEELLLCITTGINETMETVVTIAANTFTEFALAYYLDVMYGCIEDLFLEDAMNTVEAYVPKLVFQLEKLYYRVRKRTITEQLLHAAEEEEDSEVEKLMDFICAYGPGTTGLVTVPFVLYFIWDQNAQLQYTALWNVSRPDLLLYVLFCTVMIPFQWVTDMFRFNAQEVFQGWKVYEYLKYARYRYRNRTARWKGLETQLDESLEPSMRTSDQLCFSDQWYFTLGLGSSSAVLLLLSIQIMSRANYYMFADVLFFLLALITLAACILGRRGALALADLVNLWKIRSAVGNDEALFPADDLPAVLRRDPADWHQPGDARTRPAGIGDLTSADLTSDAFRRSFLEANRLWVIDQLGELLTPRTARKVRASMLSSDDDSDVASVDAPSPVPVRLSDTSAFVMRQWAATARARVPGRLGRAAPNMSTDDEDDDTRFPPVALSQTSAGVLAGWLAASRAGKAAAPAAGIMSSSGSETSSSRTRFPEPRLGMPAQLALASWLQKARQQRLQAAGPLRAEPAQDSDVSSDILSTDDSSDLDAPPALTARARAVALTWLSLMRIRRAVHTV